MSLKQAALDARIELQKWWARRDRDNPDDPPLTLEEKAVVDRLGATMRDANEAWAKGPPRVDAQAADRERETQLDAMRATIKRLEAENVELRKEVARGVQVAGDLRAECNGLRDELLKAREAHKRTHEIALRWARDPKKSAPTSRPRRAKTKPSRYACGHTQAEHGPRGGCPKKRRGSRSCKQQCGCPALQPHREGCGYVKTAAGARQACKCKGKHSARCIARQLAAGVVLRRPGT